MKVSVVLPVFNCRAYVGEAIESILNQKYQDFEFLIIDDGSTDGTHAELAKFTDPRIRHLRHENRGLAATLNTAIGLARGKYIVRQDQDDISMPHRIEKQVAFMEANDETALLGTWAQIMEGDRLVERFHKHPVSSSELRFQLLFNNYFVHSSVIIRKSVLKEVGSYSTDPRRQPPEDYELWSRIARVSDVANLPEILLHYREVPGSMSRQGPSPFRELLVRLCAENIAFAANMSSDDANIIAIAAITHGAPEMVFHKPDFTRMQQILISAAESIEGERVCGRKMVEIKNRVAGLRGGYYLHASPLRRWIGKPGMAREFCKRIHALLFRSHSKNIH